MAHFSSPDEESALDDARYLLSFLPQNNLDPPPFTEPSDPIDREDPELDTIVPDDPARPYDIKHVIARVVDGGEFLEVHASSETSHARSPVCSTSTAPSRPLASCASATLSTSRS